MGNIDPELQILMQQGSGLEHAALAVVSSTADIAEVGISIDAGPKVRVLLHFTCERDHVEQAGLTITSLAGDVASGFVAVKDLKQLSETEGVVYVELSRPLMEELDLSLEDAHVVPLHNAMPPRRGANVILGFVDSGIDIKHGCFCTKDAASGETRTRIRAIWDQTIDAPPLASERVPQPFGYGVEYREDVINEALDILSKGGNLVNKFRHEPSNGHGTYVAGIAAGNGSVSGTVLNPLTNTDLLLDERGYEGVASEADIVVVKYNRAGFMEGSAFVLDAISYIFQIAEDAGLPAVVNISQGDSIGAHDGTSLLERSIDNLLDVPGRVIVKSAGNLGLEASHAAGRVPPSGELELPVEVNANADRLCTLDLWYGGGDLFGVAIVQPDGTRSNVIHPGPSQVSLTMPNGHRIELTSNTGNPYNGDNRIYIQIRAGQQQESVEAGRWSIVLSAVKVADGRFHAWLESKQLSNGRVNHPRFAGPLVSPECTITIPGTSRKVITVTASMTQRAGEGVVVGGFAQPSSLGPSRNVSRTGSKPDIAAPGMNIISALINPIGNRQYFLHGGTSAAAAHVSGAAALLLAENPRLTSEDVKDLLCGHADTANLTVPPGSIGWGAGRLNLSDAHAALLAQSQPVPQPQPVQPQPQTVLQPQFQPSSSTD